MERSSFLFVLVALLLAMQSAHSIPVGGLNLYELSTRPYLYKLSQKYNMNISRLQDIPDEELQYFSDNHFDIVWFMGVWHLGQYGLNHDRTDPNELATFEQELSDFTLDDVIGSPYAVTNYTCNPELGSDEDIAKLRERLNNLGLKLMLDFVPNHSAVDCSYTTTNINYYVRAPQGSTPNPAQYLPNGIAYGSACPSCGSWMDTAQFNYWNPDTRSMRIEEIKKVASLSDAIRFDVAYLLLNDQIEQNWGTNMQSWGYSRPATEFWSDALSAVRSEYPDVIMLAEVYNPWESQLQQLGFDYTYNKDVLDLLKAGNLDNLRGYLSSQSTFFWTHSAHFTANHDEPRAAAVFGNWWTADAAALLTYTLPGLRFWWMWEEFGFQAKLDVHLRRENNETPVNYVTDVYTALWQITSDPVFKYGTWTYLPVSNSDSSWRLIAYMWEYQQEKRLCVINFSSASGGASVVVPNAQPRNGNDTIPVTDLLSGTTYYRSASQMRTEGLFVVINQWYAQIFEY